MHARHLSPNGIHYSPAVQKFVALSCREGKGLGKKLSVVHEPVIQNSTPRIDN